MFSDVLTAVENLPPLREVIAQHDLMAQKSLGQHFLLDLNLTKHIVASAGDLTGCAVFEIGPGPGGLTRALVASNATRVIAIEKDRRCIGALQSLVKAAQGKLTLNEGDALEVDLTQLADAPRVIIANLPYNVGTAMLLNWLRQIDAFRSLTLMFQSEVADRLVANPGSKEYGRLSVVTQFCCDVKRVLDLPARAFTPPPKIDSSVVHLTPRADRPTDISFKNLDIVTTAAFGQRRKMLRSSLKSLGGENLLARAEIAGTRRAEELSVEEFVQLARLAKDAPTL